MKTYYNSLPIPEDEIDLEGESAPVTLPPIDRPRAGSPPDRSWWLVGALFCFVVVVIVVVFADKIDN